MRREEEECRGSPKILDGLPKDCVFDMGKKGMSKEITEGNEEEHFVPTIIM